MVVRVIVLLKMVKCNPKMQQGGRKLIGSNSSQVRNWRMQVDISMISRSTPHRSQAIIRSELSDFRRPSSRSRALDVRL